MNQILHIVLIISATILTLTMQETIHLTEKSSQTIRLKSVLNNNSTKNETKRQIFWSFKRLYAVPSVNDKLIIKTQTELSQIETMISLDTEVQSNLNKKYSIESDMFDLVINNLTFADAGLYICNQWNQKSVYYQLIVTNQIKKPELIKSDNNNNNKIIRESSNTTIKCISKHAYPYPTIKWYKNEQEIENTTSISFQLIDKEENKIESQLTLVNLTSIDHMNNYSCKLVQIDQEQIWQSSDFLSLNIGFKPIVTLNLLNHKLTQNNNKLSVYDDSEIIFKCNYKSNPVEGIKIEWKLNNITQLTTNNEFNWLKRSNRYDLSSSKQMDLTCYVTNSIGYGSASYQITLLHEPVVYVEKMVYETEESSQLQVDCQIDSFPAPNKIEWLFYTNDESMPLVVSRTKLLEFKSIKYTQTNGYYVCTAQNEMTDSFGRTKKVTKQSNKIEINVKFMPQLKIQNIKQAVNLSHLSYNLTCVTSANPKPSFSWYKNGNKINSNNKYTIGNVVINSKNVYENIMTINNLNDYDVNSNYECELSNELGINRLQIDLVPISKPEQPTDLKVIQTDFMSISLNWSTNTFDGGLPQTFQIKLNNELLNTTDFKMNITNLDHNTLYSIQIKAENKLGSSDWSDSIKVKTNDLTESDSYLLPMFEHLLLNVPKNRLEFKLRQQLKKSVKFCLKMMSQDKRFKCLPIDDTLQRDQFSFDNLIIMDDLNKTQFKVNQIKILHVNLCFQAKQSICTQESFNAIIDHYNKMSYLSKQDFKSTTALNSSSSEIPISLITGICVCILSLLIILFVSVLYCIRRRNFKLCKTLLNKQDETDLKKKSTIEIIKSAFQQQQQQQHDPPQSSNKSFNADLPSSSSGATNNTSSDGYGSAGSGDLNLVNASSNSNGSLLNTKRIIVSAISNTLSRNRQSEILVTEDDVQQEKMKSNSKRQSKLNNNNNNNSDENTSTGLSNCSSNNNGIYIYSDLNYINNNDQIDSATNQQKGIITFVDGYNNSSSSGASNTDPVAINNSLSSTSSSVDSPTYGYNLPVAVANSNDLCMNNNNENNLMYIKHGSLMIDNFVQIDETVTSGCFRNANIRQNRQNSFILNSNHHQNGYLETTESGYSTPSRLKKVVYEVIV